ncbi:hypothetical protein PQG02_25330 [Nostoc sp. UHCC 0926]|uniref:hypothetical protein n=1 Tax=unclassified Nostoc TaxID=2593658 RepID=UPI00236043A7|nr:hypothetical protein [Nostoc sp. UHCC 0926]WDD31966.1 hypothetical protein PQG02_25330 [Nostoc sp. UHCC 0926]
MYFVDDNFVGDRRATMKLLPHLIDWQKCNGYPIQFATEATLLGNILLRIGISGYAKFSK